MKEFPFQKIREGQSQLLADVAAAVESKRHLIANAPTGIGKTAATIVPAVASGKTVFFLTSKHSQHRIAIETVNKMAGVRATDIIGKKWMCNVPGAAALSTRDFHDYCNTVVKDGTCQFYEATYKKGKLTAEASAHTNKLPVLHAEELVQQTPHFCPYEIAAVQARSAQLIVCDYFHIFSEGVRNSFLKKTQKDLEGSVLIIDEGQNLPQRLRELLSAKISEVTVKRAWAEAKKFNFYDLIEELGAIKEALRKLGGAEETTVEKEKFVTLVERGADGTYLQVIDRLNAAATEVREKEQKSYCGAIATFMEAWLGEDEGYLRLLSKRRLGDKSYYTLQYDCLDPSLASREILSTAGTVVLMSGTLNPMEMYRDLLGFESERTEMKSYLSAFPAGNRANLLVPTVTTKFTKRSVDEYKKIGEICRKVAAATPGNSAVFFPSYALKDAMKGYLVDFPLFDERPMMTKSEKSELLREFESKKGVLVGVIGGSFSEGVDFPKNVLKAVVIVGLPLEQQTLEVKALIDYYEKKFGRGWDYGYTYPAINRAVQAAGRMIRSETDRGVAVFLDSRYTWRNYFAKMPTDIKFTVTETPENEIKKFWTKSP